MIFTIKFRLLATISILCSVGANAQSLKGRLVDPNSSKPLRRASVILTGLKDSTARFNTISDSSGRFEFRNLYSDSFLLRVSFVGYDEFKQIVGINSEALDLGTLFIPRSIKQLGEVVVVSKIPPVQQKGDTVEYNASHFKVNPDATAEDMVKKLPGVTVDRQGTVTAQGEQVRKVTIDGRDFFGDDATAALRNLPAEIIDKIQVFDRLSDQAQFTGFDDGNTLKALNIVTKANMRNGQFGRIYAGYGTDDRYSAGGNVSFFKDDRRISVVGNFNNINQQNFASQDLLGVTSGGGNRGGFGGFGGRQGNRGGGNRAGGSTNFGNQANFLVGQQNGIAKTNAAGINFSDQWGKKLTVTGSYFFNNSNSLNDQVTNQQSLNGNDFYKEISLSRDNNYNHRINFRLDYKIDSANSLLITPSINLQKNNGNSVYSTDAGFGEIVKSSSNNTTNTDVSGYNIGNNILFRHSFKKKGRTMSVGLTTNFNRKSGNSYVVGDNKSFDTTGILMQDSLQNQFSDNFTNGNTISTNLAYTEPIGKKGQLQINYTPSFTKSKADQETYQFNNSDQKYSLFDTTLSNKFTNNYATQNGGISYRNGNRDRQISIGINFQYSKLSSDQQFPRTGSIDKSFTDILPNFRFRKKLSLRSSINVFLRTSVSPPSVSQLQNVYNVNNPLVISIGNPDLKQQYTGSLVARYTFTNTQKGQSFFANFFLQKTNDYISNAVYHAQNDSVLAPTVTLLSGGQLTVPVNLDGYWSARSLFTFGQPVKLIKSNLNLNAGVTYSRLPGLIDKEKILTNNYNYSLGVVVASNLTHLYVSVMPSGSKDLE